MACWIRTAGTLLVLLGASTAGRAQTTPNWIVTGSDRMHYTVQGIGDPRDPQGARVTLRGVDPLPGQFGASGLVLDAVPYRGHRLTLTADLSTRDATQGAMIWLRVDGARPSEAFANSQLQPVFGTTAAAHREVRVDVPADGEKIFLGTGLIGAGEVSTTDLRLAGHMSPVAPLTPPRLLDAAIAIVRGHALRAAQVDWSTLVPKLHAMVPAKGPPAAAYPAIHALLGALGDHHSLMLPPTVTQRFDHGGFPTFPPKVEAMSGDLGYIAMPGFSGVQPAAQQAFARRVIDGITRVQPQARCGWVVDLRQDPGGNMRPMLAGLRPLLGDGVVGGFRRAGGQVYPVYAHPPSSADLPDGPALEHAHVAVLLGPHTASSGEVVAVAFRGRPDTRSFGQPTAGLSTANAGYRLPDGSELFVTTSVDVDRTGHAYGGRLLPDQAVPDDPAAKGDATLAAARQWLTGACGAPAQRVAGSPNL
ncbi:S41 family peptidase [Dyella lutea]|uniref:S41 family peptidase n=1 Tax=Dyella lutea TaxID=2950441 RepID=A0ABT1FEE3_9GAMM|nr:S41 family peptidase [Dyella lutea]MCP1375756.1 S41 family peptidase [Dyella lutea]